MSLKGLKTVLAAAISLSAVVFVLTFQGSSQAASITALDGADTFKSKCASCHGVDGSGSTAAGKALKIRDLSSADVQGQTDDQLLEIIAKGKDKMPGYEKTLGEDKC